MSCSVYFEAISAACCWCSARLSHNLFMSCCNSQLAYFWPWMFYNSYECFILIHVGQQLEFLCAVAFNKCRSCWFNWKPKSCQCQSNINLILNRSCYLLSDSPCIFLHRTVNGKKQWRKLHCLRWVIPGIYITYSRGKNAALLGMLWMVSLLAIHNCVVCFLTGNYSSTPQDKLKTGFVSQVN